MSFFLQLTLNGLLIGGIYAAMTLGFSIVYGVMRILNLAHGDWLMLGAYIGWSLATPIRAAQVGLKTEGVNVSVIAVIGLASWASLGWLLGHVLLKGRVNAPYVRYLLGFGMSTLVIGGLYALWVNAKTPALDPLISMVFAALIGFGFGYVVQRTVYNRLIEMPYLTMLLVTYGTGLIFTNLILAVYSGNPLSIQLDSQRGVEIAQGITLSPVRLIVCALSFMITTGIIFFLRRTNTGRAIRAAAQNKMAARLVGINIKETYSITFAISIAATMAIGALFSGFLTLTPSLGYTYTLRSFTITVLGGLGRINGAVVGGLLLGLLESYVGGYINSGWQIAASFILLVVMLLIRPQGLLGGLKSATEQA